MSETKRLRTDGGAISDVEAVSIFVEFIKFKTVSGTGHLDGSNTACVEFLKKICEKMGLEAEILKGPDPGPKPVLVAKWAGTDSTKPCILLNSHYDVVPVLKEHWTKEAFDGLVETVDGEKRIYGRGTQDMKLVCIQYLIAISRLIADGVKPATDVYLSFVPDEEVGGTGMSWFLQSDFWNKNLKGKIGCAFDEGLANTGDAFSVFYGERTPWWVIVDAKGPTGHGSRFIKGTATHALHGFVSRALAFRKEQERLLWGPPATNQEGGCGHAKCKKLGDVTTVNMTMNKSGVSTDGGLTYAINVIPTDASAAFDIRVPPQMPHADLCDHLTRWCREAEKEWEAEEGSLNWSFAPYGGEPLHAHHMTKLDASTNKFWAQFEQVVTKDLGIKLETEVFPAATDSRFLRALNIPCFGFSPMRKCPILLHEHDEYVPEHTFLEGPKIYEALIKTMTA